MRTNDAPDRAKFNLNNTSLPDQIPRPVTPELLGIRRLDTLALSIIKSQSNKLSKYRMKGAGQFLVINETSDRYRTCIGTISFLAVLSMTICSIEEELYLQHGKSFITDRVLLLCAHSLITLFLVYSIIKSYELWLQMKRATGKMLTLDSLTFDNQVFLVFEVVINLIAPFPALVNTTFQESVYVADISLPKRVNTVLFTAMFFLRSYHLVRPLLYYSYYMGNRAYRVCNIGNHQCTFSFAMKAWFSVSSFSVTAFLYGFATFYFGILLRFNEEQAHRQNSDLQHYSWRNSLWCAYITMTTVGYGDFYPTTTFGRYVGILCAFVGMFLTSLAVIALFEILEFTPSEEISYRLIDTLRKKQKLMKRAVMMMTTSFKANKYKNNRYIKMYSAAKTLFKQTSLNLRLQKLGLLSPEDYLRRDLKGIKKETTKAKDMVIAIFLYTQRSKMNESVNASVLNNRFGSRRASVLSKYRVPDSKTSGVDSALIEGLNLSTSPFRDEL